jgi:hydroxymethylpyrimidine/phosphomethylpyrimidine kinase
MISAMTIAASDPGGGAGIEADLKTFTALGIHGTVIITAIAIENTLEVRSVHPLPLEIIEDQFRVVMEDFDVRAIKCGLLFNEEIAELVAELIGETRRGGKEVDMVLDPVMVAQVGAPLAKKSLIKGLKTLVPMAKVITPNRYEAEQLLGKPIEDIGGSLEELSRLGAEYVLLKGGHFDEPKGKSVDFLYESKTGKTTILQERRFDKGTHGSGCTLSSAIAAFLAAPHPVEDSVRRAKSFISRSIMGSYRPGRGVGVVDQLGISR